MWQRVQAERFGTSLARQESGQTKGIETGTLQGHCDGMKQTQYQSCWSAPCISGSRYSGVRLNPRKKPVQEREVSWVWWHTF